MCRAEGMKLFLKGARCQTPKCGFERRPNNPGMHGRQRQKPTEYGTQLREKQKIRRIYGLLERQFRIYFERAARAKGVTGDLLMTLLEARLDNVVHRAGFAPSRKLARQLVNHGLVAVNGRKVTIPSCQVRAGDVIAPYNEKGKTKVGAELQVSESYVPPEWIIVDRATMAATIVRMPQRADVNLPINESLVVELYSK
jgi:small subunit ribosomal protein S4